MEANFLSHISLGMWVMFGLGILSVLMYSWTTIDEHKGVKRYFKLTWKNFFFHLVASLMVFIAIEELSEKLIEVYIPILKGSGTYHFSMSGLVGMFGSAFIALIIEKSKSIFRR